MKTLLILGIIAYCAGMFWFMIKFPLIILGAVAVLYYLCHTAPYDF